MSEEQAKHHQDSANKIMNEAEGHGWIKCSGILAHCAMRDSIALGLRDATNAAISESLARERKWEYAWGDVRSRILCTIDPACAEHGFKEAMDAVQEMDKLQKAFTDNP